MPTRICWCFGHTDEDIRADALRHGRSVILEDILKARSDGLCRCRETNPSGG